MKKKMARILLLLALAFSALTPVTAVQAIVVGCSWNGSVDANWSTPGNWNVGCSGTAGIPGTGDTLTFPTGASNAVMNDDLPAISLQGLTFSGALNYTLNGANAISLTGGMDVQAGNQTINTPLAVANGGVIFHAASGSNLALGGTLSLGTNNLSLTVDSAAGVTGMQIMNNVTGSGAAKLTKTGSGNLQVIGDIHSSIFDVDVNAGSMSLGPNPPGVWSGLPWSGRTTLALGTNLNLSSHAVIGSIAGAGNINKGSYLFQIRENQTTTFTGDISGSNQLTIIGNGADALTIDRAGGTLSHTGEINVNTSGILKLVNTTATAPVPGFAVPNGTLELNNSHVGAINLGYSGGGFNYDGTLILSGSTASIASQITLVNNSRITSVINSTTDYGRISVTSPVDLGAGAPTFTLQGSYAPISGDVFTIIQNTNSGTSTQSNAAFSNLSQGGTIPFNTINMAADYQAAGNTAFTLTATTPDVTPPNVQSIVCTLTNPTSSSDAVFTVTFSESVTGVEIADFSLTTTGISGESVSSVDPNSSSVYFVHVATGTGSGTLRLDVPASATVTDLALNPLAGLPFTAGEVYTVSKNAAPTDLNLSNLSMAENQPAGTTVGTFTSTDSNVGDTFTYSMVSGAGSADNAAFTISGNALQTAYPFNATVKNSYSIRVRTTDQGGLYFEKAFTVTVTNLPAIFSDVPDSYWANTFIERLYNAGITGGCSLSPLMYCPETNVNRAQMAVFLLRGEHGSAYVPPAVGTGTGFTDVPADYWAAAWIKQLAFEGITSGCGPSLYCPETSVTRDQMAVFLLRAEHGASYTPPPATGVFTDVPSDYWAAAWIERLAFEGITGGCGVGTYCPTTPVTRAQMAVFLVRAFNLP